MYSSHIMAIDLLQIFTSMPCLSVYSVFSATSQPVKRTEFRATYMIRCLVLPAQESPAFWFSLPRMIDHRNSLK